MLSSEHLSLRGEHPKFFPKFVGPFKIAALPVQPNRHGGQREPTASVSGAPFCLGPSEEDVQPEARRRLGGGEDADEQGMGALSIKT